MNLSINSLKFVGLVSICSIGMTTVIFAQQEQIRGVRLEAKRSADMPQGRQQPALARTIDIDQVKEFDRVFGTCVGNDGMRIAGVSVQLYGKIQGRDGRSNVYELIASMETGKDGEFDFKNLQNQFKTEKFERNFYLVIRKRGVATQFRNSIGWKSEKQDIFLAKRAMVRGRIKDDLGQPVSNASVAFYNPLKKILPDIYSAKTDSEGRFQIDDYER